MSLGLSLTFLIVGLALLWKSGDWSVTNAVRFALVFKIESFIIGFFIFAVATGLPEITSAIVSSFEKVPELSAGNLIGSTFVNLTLQLGIASILARKLWIEPILRNRLTQTSIAIAVIMTALLFLKIGSIYLGAALIAVYLLSFIWFPKAPKKHFTEEVKKEKREVNDLFFHKIKVLMKLAISLAFLVFSAWLTVTAAVALAKQIHVPIVLIGGTIIAIGTALPELTLEIHAIRRKEYGLALGDIFGSGMLNISFILGLLVLFNRELTFTIPQLVFPFFATAMCVILYRLFCNKPFTLSDGIILIMIFVLYISRVIIGYQFF